MSASPVSERGFLLVDSCNGEGSKPFLTVELYTKWYGLYLVEEKKVTKIQFDELEPYVPHKLSAYVDHVPNPKAVQAFAEAKDYHLEPLALELIVGRWMVDVEQVF